MPFDRAASAAIVQTRRADREAAAVAERARCAVAFREPLPAANDNARPDGRHEWPARDRLKAGKLFPDSATNAAALRALQRFRDDLDAAAGTAYWSAFGDDAASDDDAGSGYGADMHRERVTAERLVALHMAGSLEYRTVGGHRQVVERDGCRVFEIDDRPRGERGPAAPTHPPEVARYLADQYRGAAWPRDAGKPADIFLGATIRRCHEGRATASPEDRLLRAAFARRVLAFIRGGMPSGLHCVLVNIADGATAEEIGVVRGHSDKRASAVGTELMRVALEGLVECYREYDGVAAA